MLDTLQLQPIVDVSDPGMVLQRQRPVTLMEVEQWEEKMAVILLAKRSTALTGEASCNYLAETRT